MLPILFFTACTPVKSAPKQPDQHTFLMEVLISKNDKPAKLPLHLWADVTIKNNMHAIDRGNSGHQYPATWEVNDYGGKSELDYWARSNPTTFRIRATLYLRDLISKPLNDRYVLNCRFYKDDRLIDPLNLRGAISTRIAVKNVQNLLDNKQTQVSVNCAYTDNSPN